jgi:hypothetical protein
VQQQLSVNSSSSSGSNSCVAVQVQARPLHFTEAVYDDMLFIKALKGMYAIVCTASSRYLSYWSYKDTTLHLN